MGKAKADQIARVESIIINVRGEDVILDDDLASLFGIETKLLNQAIKAKRDRLVLEHPEMCTFQLNRREYETLANQIVELKRRGGFHYLPYVFTDWGVEMAAGLINTSKALKAKDIAQRAFLDRRFARMAAEKLNRMLNDGEAH